MFQDTFYGNSNWSRATGCKVIGKSQPKAGAFERDHRGEGRERMFSFLLYKYLSVFSVVNVFCRMKSLKGEGGLCFSGKKP